MTCAGLFLIQLLVDLDELLRQDLGGFRDLALLLVQVKLFSGDSDLEDR